MNVVLCGMPTCGKSFYGVLASQQLNIEVIETDELVVKAYAAKKARLTTCRDIYKIEGERYFRTLEWEVLQQLKCVQGSIIVTGGGILTVAANVRLLQQIGWLLYLKVSREIVSERLSRQKSAPAYLDDGLEEHDLAAFFEQRESYYKAHCHFSVDLASQDVVRIIKMLMQKEKPHGQ